MKAVAHKVLMRVLGEFTEKNFPRGVVNYSDDFYFITCPWGKGLALPLNIFVRLDGLLLSFRDEMGKPMVATMNFNGTFLTIKIF